MWKVLFELDGTLRKVDEINRAIAEQTGDPKFFDYEENDLSYLEWVEWKDGKTFILAEEA